MTRASSSTSTRHSPTAAISGRSTFGRCRPIAATRTIPIGVTLTSAPRTQTSYGIGYSTDTRPRSRFGRNNRRFNDRGHQFGVNVQLSPVISEVRANYRLPINSSRSEWLNLDAGVRSRTPSPPRAISSRSARAACASALGVDAHADAGAARRGLRGRGSGEPRAAADARRQLDAHPRRQRDPPDRKARSWRSRCAARTTRSFPTRRSCRPLRSANGSGRRSAASASSSAARPAPRPSSEFEELPASVRFFAGGDNSVRGYAFEELGPVDADGKVIGGSSLATGSFEFEQPLRARWSLAFFVDSGNAFERLRDGREDERRHGRPLAVAARADPHRSRAAARGGSRRVGACTSRWGPTYEVAQAQCDRSGASSASSRSRALPPCSGQSAPRTARRGSCADCSPAHRKSRSRASAARCSAACASKACACARRADELDIDDLVLEWDAPAALMRVLAFRSAHARQRDVPARARRHGERRRTAQAAVAAAHRRRKRRHAVDHRPRANAGVQADDLCNRHLRRPTPRAHGRRRDVRRRARSARAPRSTSRTTSTLDVAGEWSGPLAGVAASGTVELAGTWPDLTIRHELTAPFAATTTTAR